MRDWTWPWYFNAFLVLRGCVALICVCILQVEELRSRQEAERKNQEVSHSQKMESLKLQYETSIQGACRTNTHLLTALHFKKSLTNSILIYSYSFHILNKYNNISH